jgi:hypothetical protein
LNNLFHTGTKVPVYYDTAEPRRSALLIPPPTWVRREFVLGGFGLVATFAIGWHFVKILRTDPASGSGVPT